MKTDDPYFLQVTLDTSPLDQFEAELVELLETNPVQPLQELFRSLVKGVDEFFALVFVNEYDATSRTCTTRIVLQPSQSLCELMSTLRTEQLNRKIRAYVRIHST